MKSTVKDFFRDLLYGNRLTAVIRVFLGLVMLLSGVFKASDIEAFGVLIARYGIIPESLVPYPAIALPFVEILLGLLLITGSMIRPASLIGMLLMAFFTVIIAVNVARGETFECGCFGTGSLGFLMIDRISPGLVVRDLAFLGLFFLIFRTERHVASIEQLLVSMRLKKL